MNWRTRQYHALAVSALLSVCVVLQATGLLAQKGDDPSGNRVRITALSTRPDRVSGGDVLVQVSLPETSAKPTLAATLNGRDVSAMFRPIADTPNTFVGLVTGLVLGRNMLRVADKGSAAAEESLDLTNYPSTGPIISGPHIKPFVCQTDSFKLPDGSTLGAASDANCTVATRLDYVYMPEDGKEFKPLSNTTALPGDVATTTTIAGKTVPFVVRVETGTMNRGIYQNVVLHDVTKDPPPAPFSPPPAWNRRLVAVHGTGCPGGWYRQGGVMGVNPLGGASITRLGEGYALFTNTLNHPTNSCNPFLAGETTMMGKEHVIELFGVPEFTISMGSSGGAYTSLQVADQFPGLFDGILFSATFPDALSIALAGMDARLLAHYFAVTDPAGFTETQKVAVSGYAGMKAFIDAANQAQRTDPVPGRVDLEGYNPAVWNDAVPRELRYDPKSNVRGARPTVFDAARNVYGVDRATGFALRPFDNVGVQYGLGALNSGRITPGQFLDLNERIGGYDQDSNYAASRSVGDTGAIRRAYQSGVTLSGGGGLADIPVFDDGGYNEAERYHYQWFHFAVRERMRNMNGSASNHVFWRGPVQAEQAWQAVAKWVAAVKADRSSASQRDKVVRNKPAEVVDGCWITETGATQARFVTEPQTFSSKPDTECNRAYPSYSFTRQVAGGPLDGNILKCHLKPIDLKDYSASFDQSELQRLRAVFQDGVCDWSKTGVEQVRVMPWSSFGPAPENLVFDVGAAP